MADLIIRIPRIATEKVEQEIEAGASGIVHWTASVGTTYDIGAEIGVITS